MFPATGNSSTIHPVNQARNLNSSETFCSSSHLPASHLAHLLYLLNGFHTYYLLTSVVIASMQIVNTPGDSDGTESACNIGDLGSITGSGRSPGEGNGNPLQYSCQENPMNGEAWQATVPGVAKSRTRLSNFTFTFSFTLALASFKPSSPHHPERRTMAQPCLNTCLSLYHSKLKSQTPKKSITTRVLSSIHFLFSPSGFLLSGMQQFFVTCIQHSDTWLSVSAQAPSNL